MMFWTDYSPSPSNTMHRSARFALLEQTMKGLATEEYEYRASLHLAFIVTSLFLFQQRNMSPRFDGNHPALQDAIHMPDVVRQKQVVYFSLLGAQNIQNVLAQAREFGLACILAHQTMSQLNPPGGVDLRELVPNCTGVKLIDTARDKISKEYVSDLSGHVGYYKASWNQTIPDVAAGRVSPLYAAAQANQTALLGIQAEIAPRLTHEDLADISRHPNLSIVSIERNTGYSAFLGAFPIHTDWPLSAGEYNRRHLDMPWPGGGLETIVLTHPRLFTTKNTKDTKCVLL
jgi:hypothetical protein